MSKRIIYYDILNIVACLGVVFLHCNGLVHTYSDSAAWKESLVVEVVAFWAVPVFFMLTGAKTMNYREKYSTKDFLIKRAKRLLVPFLAWSLILYIYRFSGFFGVPRPVGSVFSVGGFITDLMTNTIEPTYWFFFSMFAVTLAMPVLSLLISKRKTLWYVVLCVFVLQSVCPIAFTLLHIPWNAALELPVGGGYVLYVILGYLLATGSLMDRKGYRVAVYIAGFACLALRYAYTLVSSEALGDVDRLFFDYLAFTAVFPSAAVFVFCKYHTWNVSRRVSGALATIAGCSFGIYLIHKVFIDNILVGTIGISMDSLFMRCICPFIVYLISLGFVYCLKRIPGLRALVP